MTRTVTKKKFPGPGTTIRFLALVDQCYGKSQAAARGPRTTMSRCGSVVIPQYVPAVPAREDKPVPTRVVSRARGPRARG